MKKAATLSCMTAACLALGTLAMPFVVQAADLATYDFESGTGGWSAWGETSVSVTNNAAHTGSQSLYIGDRVESWNGAACDMAGILSAGQNYEFSAWVYQTESTVNETIKLQMKYLDASGEAVYDTVGTAKTGGEWANIEVDSYTVPAGATGLTLYFETPESLIGFYVDDITITGSKAAPVITTGEYETGVGTGLKNRFADYFKVGTCLSGNEVTKPQAQALVEEHFNSVTPENELKPEALLSQSASQSNGNNVNPQISLNYGARTILEYCDKNSISVRGHCLVWHSQTPDWFFKEDFSNSGAYVSKDIMDQRMENYIKNVMALLAAEYPNVEFYAWDVVNEAFTDQGVMRTAGSNNTTSGNSLWTQIYGDDSFIEKAFTYARKYAPKGCKLFYNDYNEYIDSKMSGIIPEVTKLYNAGLLDGMGFQSHLSTTYPSVSQFKSALGEYAAIGCEIQITELDITCSDAAAQATVYKGIFEACKAYKDQISAVVFWGTQDGMSWRSSQNPLIFNSSYQPKEAYFAIANATPMGTQQQTTTAPIVTTTVPTTTTTAPPETTGTTDTTIGTSPGISTRMELKNPPDKLTYQIGEELDLTGGVVSLFSMDRTGPFQNWTEVSMNDDSLIQVDDHEFDNTTPGKYTIFVSYAGPGRNEIQSFEVEVTTEAPSYVYLWLVSAPDKLTYRIGEELDLTGGVASASGYIAGGVYWDTFHQPLTYSQFQVDASAFNNQVPGVYPIIVSITESGITKTVSFDVTVYDPNAPKGGTLSLLTVPTKNIYGYKEALDLSGLGIGFTPTDGTDIQDVTSLCSVDTSTFDNTIPGTYEFPCTYVTDAGETLSIQVPVIVDFEIIGTYTRTITPENMHYRTGYAPDLRGVRAFADITYPDGTSEERDITEHCTFTLLNGSTVRVQYTPQGVTSTIAWGQSLLTFPIEQMAPDERVYGDINDDLKVDLSDLILMARFVAEDDEIDAPNQWGILNADVTGEQLINADDVIRVARFLAKLDSDLEPAQ